jgi:hypothetical protein
VIEDDPYCDGCMKRLGSLHGFQLSPIHQTKGETVNKRTCEKCGVGIRINSKTGKCSPCDQGLRPDHPARLKNQQRDLAASANTSQKPTAKAKQKKTKQPKAAQPETAQGRVSIVVTEDILDSIWASMSLEQKGQAITLAL